MTDTPKTRNRDRSSASNGLFDRLLDTIVDTQRKRAEYYRKHPNLHI